MKKPLFTFQIELSQYTQHLKQRALTCLKKNKFQFILYGSYELYQDFYALIEQIHAENWDVYIRQYEQLIEQTEPMIKWELLSFVSPFVTMCHPLFQQPLQVKAVKTNLPMKQDIVFLIEQVNYLFYYNQHNELSVVYSKNDLPYVCQNNHFLKEYCMKKINEEMEIPQKKNA